MTRGAWTWSIAVLFLMGSGETLRAGDSMPAGEPPGDTTADDVEVEPSADQQEQVWAASYAEAVLAARARKTMALLWFVDPKQREKNDRFERDVLGAAEVKERLARFIPARLDLNARYPATARGASTGPTSDSPVGSVAATGSTSTPAAERVLEHGAFAELAGEPGLAIIDLTDEASPHFHRVVSIYPLQSRSLSADQLVALLDLPSGSLTQRTLIWAVWTHPERPQSAAGTPHDVLEHEAENHSNHQASIRVQGHHLWGSRFQRLLGRLPAGLVPQEVCAESWPGQRLVDAAEECVSSWRHSSGHWAAVRHPHPVFGYDMKRGSNGVWYATGVFGRR